MCKLRTLSFIPNPARAVKAASAIHPNQSGESCDPPRRSALFCISSLPLFGHSCNSPVCTPSSRLP